MNARRLALFVLLSISLFASARAFAQDTAPIVASPPGCCDATADSLQIKRVKPKRKRKSTGTDAAKPTAADAPAPANPAAPGTPAAPATTDATRPPRKSRRQKPGVLVMPTTNMHPSAPPPPATPPPPLVVEKPAALPPPDTRPTIILKPIPPATPPAIVPAPAAVAEVPAVGPGAAATSPSTAAPSLDFDLLAPEQPVSAEEKERREEQQRSLLTRRSMLTVHQVTGFVLLAGLTGTVVLGQLNYHDKYGGGGDTGKWIKPHEITAYATSAVFATAGLLALFAPSPIDAPPRLSTSTLHKTAMAIATAGMVAEVVLGIVAARNEGQIDQRNFALAHQINGYVTLGAVVAGFGILTF